MDNNQSNIIAKGIVKAVFSLAAILLLFWFLYQIRTILVYVIIAFIISLIGRPVKRFFIKRFKLRDTLATILTLFLFIGFFVLMASIFVPMIYEQGKNLSLLDFNRFQEKINLLFVNLNEHLHQKNITILDDFSLKNIFSEINLKVLPQLINSIIGILGNVVIGIFAVSFISFFLLKDSTLAADFLFKFIPNDDKKQFKSVIENIKNLLSRYFIGLFIQVTILFIAYSIMLNIFDVENATLIALLSALLVLIPYIGPIVGWILMISLMMTAGIQEHNFAELMITARNITIAYFLIQMWDAFVDQPLIFSKSVKAHPLEIFLVIMISGTLFGIVGMIVAVPSFTMLRLLFKEFYQEYKAHFTIW
jgi:predicted PurR-regulated permease PerM